MSVSSFTTPLTKRDGQSNGKAAIIKDLIIGAIVGPILFLLLVASLYFFIRYRRKHSDRHAVERARMDMESGRNSGCGIGIPRVVQEKRVVRVQEGMVEDGREGGNKEGSGKDPCGIGRLIHGRGGAPV
ncbi:hypothetical protein BJ508DRAFT_311918 [Ascobolus immersus RN42]|uniref:Uncharacterized protein n=1 Tax=Ascobolus immersus RN42 TaxID=1160509 RepID=A0A3N4HNV1_ASCIM|nr:hypothetical protein BJ508DRAFT_311918 [Ascobolus immersus RN42]